MLDALPVSADYRYERKFVFTGITARELESLIKVHPAVFSEIYPERFINNIYLDSFNLESYFSRIDGSGSAKVRIRWYGGLFGDVERPVLEIKAKEGALGRKQVFPLKRFSLQAGFNLDTIRAVFKESDLPDVLKIRLAALEFALLNRFRRKYFQSADRDFRVTIDSDIEYYELSKNHNSFLNKNPESGTIVLEIKYAPEMDAFACGIVNRLPLRLTRNSKYVNGVERLNPW